MQTKPTLAPAVLPASRHGAIDGVRGVAVIAMIIVHCFAFYAAYDTQENSAGFVILDVGKLTAVFILCMGVSSAFSRRREPGDLARRGAQLLLYGYGLNVLKFIVPWLVFRNLPAGLVTDLGWEPGSTEAFLHLLFLGDILHMCGLSLLVLAGLRTLGAGPWHLVSLGTVVASVAPLLWGVRGGGPIATYLCDLLFSERFTVFFPLFPWMAYMLVGFGLGDLLRRANAANVVVYGRWCGVGLGLIALGVGVGVAWPAAWKGWDFYRTGPAGVLAVIGFSLMVFQVSNVIWPRMPPLVRTVLGYASVHVTRLYVISWVVICWLMGWVGFMSHAELWPLAGLTTLVFALTIVADRLVPRVRPV
jgi:uncharacterized membrane protein